MHKIQDLWGIDTARASRLAMIDEYFDREMLSSGMVYFLNTQKLGLSSRLVQKSEMRRWTIWQTLANTARKKGEMLYFIIDEAHRGTAGRLSSEATTIMQKFIKGSEAEGIEAMPLVIGMSATLERFNSLVGTTTSGRQSVDVKTEDVRASGLLKDRIFITYPSKGLVQRDMSMLDAAARDWQDKCQRWERYCNDNGTAPVRPALIVQVDDNVSKAKALAQYAAENPAPRRVQLIRMTRDSIGTAKFCRLDMTKSEVRKAVMPITTNGELNHLFDTVGIY